MLKSNFATKNLNTMHNTNKYKKTPSPLVICKKGIQFVFINPNIL